MIEIDPAILAQVENAQRYRSYVDPIEPGRRYFSVDFDCVGYTIVAQDEAHVKELMPAIYQSQFGGEPDTSWEEALSNHDLTIREIEGHHMIWDDGRDGCQHPINTYALGTWASTEY